MRIIQYFCPMLEYLFCYLQKILIFEIYRNNNAINFQYFLSDDKKKWYGRSRLLKIKDVSGNNKRYNLVDIMGA